MDGTPFGEAGTWLYCILLVIGIVVLTAFAYSLKKGAKSAAVITLLVGGAFFAVGLYGLLAF